MASLYALIKISCPHRAWGLRLFLSRRCIPSSLKISKVGFTNSGTLTTKNHLMTVYGLVDERAAHTGKDRCLANGDPDPVDEEKQA